MSSGGHPGLTSCVSLPDKVLSGSSDSNSIRLCGPSHGIFLVFVGLSAYVLSNVSSSACRFRPPGWNGSGSCLFFRKLNSRIHRVLGFLPHPCGANMFRVHPISVRWSSENFDHHFDWSSLIPAASPYSLLDLFQSWSRAPIVTN